ncbi:MAG: GAF domain-containing protein [Chloroflexia bacterium]|nr:GAF domain-containing protein [Chloroflexia bacterium]
MRSDRAELRRLKWIAVFVPLMFLFAIELIRARTLPGLFDAWPGNLLIAGVILLGVLCFAETLFGVVGSIQQRTTRQNLELLALHEAGIAITGELELDRVLQQVVDQARELDVARYGALSLLSDDGGIQSFLTSGIAKEERETLGPIPVGHGLLRAVIDEGKVLRIPDLTQDPRSYGFPKNHPPMHSLLAVPILSQDRILGSLYLTEKEHGRVFDNDDQLRLERFATHAAIAIENARLY